MTAMDRLDAILAILEPTPSGGLVVDNSGAQPFRYLPNHLYCWMPEPSAFTPAGTRDTVGRNDREDFGYLAVYVPPQSTGDESEMRTKARVRALSTTLATKAAAYVAAIAAKPVNRPHWLHLAAVVEHDHIRTLDVRAVGIRLRGYTWLH
jgi:hypothetical protein